MNDYTTDEYNMMAVISTHDTAVIVDKVEQFIEAGLIEPRNPYKMGSPHWYMWQAAVQCAWQFRRHTFRPPPWWQRPVSTRLFFVALVVALAVVLEVGR